MAIVLALFFAAGAFAGFNFTSENIVRNYSAGQLIQGTINISFDNEPAEAEITSNFEGNLTLLELLEENGFEEGTEFDCNTPNCLDDYSQGDVMNNFILTAGEDEKIVGLVINNRPNVNIESVEFSINNNLGPACFRQIGIDFLNNDKNLITNDNYIDEECFDPRFGCFDPSLDESDYDLATIQTGIGYCEKIALPSGPAFNLSARIKNSTTGSASLEMRLHDNDGNFLDKCTLPDHEDETQDLGCIVNFSSAVERDYYVCVIAQSPSSYKIKTESRGDVCGTTSPG
ncbi:MAG: hypothetical protein IH948_06580, partial [Bacteroidetes bacterium]|nr:hypothetical protein [Bacteroidota bacterium]